VIFSSFARRAALSVAFMLATAASVSASELKEVKIGVLTDMAGPYSDAVGPGSVLAAQMAVADFIAAEKPAFTASVLSADHGNKPDVATNLARAWFERDNVDMLVDLTNSAVALAGGKIATQYDRLQS
jgi:branched-chain amino acid transport system substrate-binding protein